MNHSKLSSMPTKSHSHIWGRPLHLKESPNSEELAQHFTGKEWDRVSGLDYFPARYYDSDVGYWLSPDAARQFGNLYLYSGNGFSPLNGVDYTGNTINTTSQNSAYFQGLIQENAGTAFSFGKDGNLKFNPNGEIKSQSYADALVSMIKSPNIAFLDKLLYTYDKNNQLFSVMSRGDGYTKGVDGGANVVITGFPNITDGGAFQTPADVLTHELVGHAQQALGINAKGNPVELENVVRQELGKDLRPYSDAKQDSNN